MQGSGSHTCWHFLIALTQCSPPQTLLACSMLPLALKLEFSTAMCGLENLISFLSFGSNLEVLDLSEQMLSSKLIAAQALIIHFEAIGETS